MTSIMDTYQLIKNFAGLFLQRLQGTRSLSIGDIRNQVKLASSSPGVEPLTSQEMEKMIHELEAEFQTVIGAERELIGDDEGWSPWLPSRRAEFKWEFWGRYRTYLARNSFKDDVLSRLESSTDRVLAFMGDPGRLGSWDRRGLVVGLVQSGKTAHYVGVVNKAVDVGYKVVVILTGFTESLRVQTQDRLEKGVLGYSLRPNPADPKQQVAKQVGVDFIHPVRPRLDSVTTLNNDFKTGIARNFAIQVGGNPIVFVVKKNATVLKNLLQWVTNFGTDKDKAGNTYVRGIPLLVIDDESDVGSIDTKKGAVDELGEINEDHDPVKINKQIRKLVSLFDQSSYIGYTATPFANVLVHDGKRSGIDPEDGLLIGEDLFPRSFIVSLPTPSNHVGPVRVFGSTEAEGVEAAGLPIIRHVTDTEIGADNEVCWIPASHKRTHVPRYIGSDKVPPSLRDAILSFVLVIAARRIRGDARRHNSMLVHVTRFTDVQARVHEQVEREMQDIVSRLRNRTLIAELLSEFRRLWQEGGESFCHTTKAIRERSEAIYQNPVHTWEEIQAQLLDAASSIEVRTINGTAGDVLDYDRNEDGLNVIAIGGDKLARGLTLEGLSISYFLRCSRMYDTLMQMGRWFGYRPGYLDLCRLYTTRELADWFSHIATATEELRREFDLMANSHRTPKEFGLKVRSHPTMMVTSAVKMRDGESLQVSFQGTMVQTIDFSRSASVVQGNWAAAEALIDRAEFAQGAQKRGENAFIWSEVHGQRIVEFLESYQEHETARTVRTRELRQYVENQLRLGGLKNWTVLLSGGGTLAVSPLVGSEAKVRLVERDWHDRGSRQELIRQSHYRIRVLINPPDELADLGEEQIKDALQLDIKDWEATGGIRRGRVTQKPTAPGGRFARIVRSPERGLLILYPLDSTGDKGETADLPILGFAISFPSLDARGQDTPVTYIVGNVYQRQELEVDD
jgi:hypothetical protein